MSKQRDGVSIACLSGGANDNYTISLQNEAPKSIQKGNLPYKRHHTSDAIIIIDSHRMRADNHCGDLRVSGKLYVAVLMFLSKIVLLKR